MTTPNKKTDFLKLKAKKKIKITFVKMKNRLLKGCRADN